MKVRRVWVASALFAGSTLAFAQQPSPSAQSGYSIRGVVVSATTGKPLERAVVSLLNTEAALKGGSTSTSEDGSFDFEHLQPGKYVLEASRRGYEAASYDEHDGFSAAIVTGPGLNTTDLRFKLLPAAVISGIVTDDAGEPVRNAEVCLYRKSSSEGLGKITQAGVQQTDDIGAFEFARLGPGDYFASVSATPWYAVRPQPKFDGNIEGNSVPDTQPAHSPLDVAYPLTFYPDTTDPDEATPIPLRAGDHAQLNFSLHAGPAIHVRIRLSGDQKDVGILPQITQNIFGEQFPITSANLTYGPGFADLSGVPPGHYEMHFIGASDQSGQTSDLNLATDTTIDSPPLAPVVSIRGKVAMISGGDLPASLYIEFDSHATFNRGIPVEKDGTFTMEMMQAGDYEVNAGGPGTSYSVVRMAADEASTDGRLLKFGSSPTNLAIVIAENSATINGYARQNGKSAAGVMVVLVPRDPGSNRELFRRDESNSDGSFSLSRVAPGAYTLIAIDDGWSLDWARPEVIANYLVHGLKVNVGFSQKTMNLSEPVEVQPR